VQRLAQLDEILGQHSVLAQHCWGTSLGLTELGQAQRHDHNAYTKEVCVLEVLS